MTNTVTIIAQEVDKATGVPIRDMLSERREAPIVRARHMAIMLTREFTKFGAGKVAKAWGRADHTTVLHAYRTWPERARKHGLEWKYQEVRSRVLVRIKARNLVKAAGETAVAA
jgi:chromosomal replication initiation ATPase DnaA